MIAVDNNILIYYLTEGAFTEIAQRCFDKDPDWIAPGIILYELHNTLLGYFRRGQLTLSEIQDRYSEAIEVLAEYDFMPEAEELFQLAINSGCTSYDCSYIALAKKHNINLVTADKDLLKAFPDIAIAMEKFLR